MWETIWAEAGSVRPDRMVLVTGAVALLVIAWAPSWRLARQAVTIVHEGGHALAAVLSGRALHGVRLHRDSSGVTVSSGLARGPGAVATIAAGYPAPALLGLAGAVALDLGHAAGLLWGLLAVLALLVLQVRNLFGLWVLLVAGAAVFATTWWLPRDLETACAHGLVWFLLLAAPRTVWELQGHRRRRRRGASDADLLAGITVLPGLAWVGVFLLVTLGCLAGGGWLLVS